MKEKDYTKEQIDRINENYQNANLMDDRKFREIAKFKSALQEILRVILNDDKLEVVENIYQKNESLAIYHGVILDCLIRLFSGALVNVEIQRYFGDNPFCRMLYYQSIIRVTNSLKDSEYKYDESINIITIMFCEKDIVGAGLPIYKFKHREEQTGLVFENGFSDYYAYVNAEVKEEDKKLKELFKMFKETNYVNKDFFPEFSEAKEIVNNIILGGDDVFQGTDKMIYDVGEEKGIKKGIEQGIEQGVKSGRESVLVFLVRNGDLTKEVASKTLGMPLNEFEALMATN